MGGRDGGDRPHVRGGRAARRVPRGCGGDLSAVPEAAPSRSGRRARPLPDRIVRLEEDRVVLLDQRRLPDEEVELECRNAAEVAEAIRTLAVRGAPAIGIAAAYGYALAAEHGHDLDEADRVLRSSRPTAVNLAWALDRMREDPSPERAREIHAEEVERCRRMAEHAVTLLRPGTRALTHCNTGALATGGYGTALGAIRLGWERGLVEHVWVTETRPLNQGSRLTAWELDRLGIPFAVIADSAVASADGGRAGGHRVHRRRPHRGERRHRQQDRHVRARRARAPSRRAVRRRRTDVHGRHRGAERRRDPDRGAQLAEESDARFPAFNPAFDITPAELIDAIVTEEGVRRGVPRRMKLLVLAAGYATRLYPLTRDRPKALLPVGGRPMADWLLERLEPIGFDAKYVVTNAKLRRPVPRSGPRART